MAAQLAPFVTVELIPYFLKSPFSCATTMGEQSVRAMMPKLRFGVSGASDAEPAVAAQLRGRKLRTEAVPARRAPWARNARRLSVLAEVGDGVMV